MDTVQKKISRVEWIDTARGINILLTQTSHLNKCLCTLKIQ